MENMGFDFGNNAATNGQLGTRSAMHVSFIPWKSKMINFCDLG